MAVEAGKSEPVSAAQTPISLIYACFLAFWRANSATLSAKVAISSAFAASYESLAGAPRQNNTWKNTPQTRGPQRAKHAAKSVPIKTPSTGQTGGHRDVWYLGRHRLICGDAQDATAYARLLDGDTIDVIFTDPPDRMDEIAMHPTVKPVALVAECWKRTCNDSNCSVARVNRDAHPKFFARQFRWTPRLSFGAALTLSYS